MVTQSAHDLMAIEQPAWPEVAAAIESAPEPVRVLPVDPDRAAQVIERLQVSAGSVLGALAVNCGGLILDHGWLRILGGGHRRQGVVDLVDLATANGLETTIDRTEPPGHLVVAVDVLGGHFAIDGGGLGVAPGQVCYFAPDSLRWQSVGAGHGQFVHAMISGATAQFYEGFRWPGWQAECASLAYDQGWSLYPPPFTAEGKDLARVARRPAPITELLEFYATAARQLDGGG